MSEHNHPHDNPAPDQPAEPTTDPATPAEPLETPAGEAPKGKQYSLTHMETELVRTVFQNNQANFAALLSHIAAGRIGYQVTDRTRMQLSNDAKILILSEGPAVPNQPQPPAPANDSGVRAAG